MMTTPELSCDVLIIGSGAAGLSLALRLAEKHKVIVLSKGPVSESSTFYAQGGIAAVFDETDSIASHVEDTLIAGAGICDRHAVEFVASNARTCVQWLIDQGVLFDTHVQPNGKESYHLTREGGHSHRRILHAADATGKEVETTLVSRAQNHPNIQVLERSNAVDLIISDKMGLPGPRRVVGAWIWNRNKEWVETCHAKSVVLATGGASKVYQYTTNPDISSGDGIAQAVGSLIWNLTSFIPPPFITRRRVIFSLPKRCVAKAHTLNVRTVHGLCRTLTNAGNWRRAILSPALLTMR